MNFPTACAPVALVLRAPGELCGLRRIGWATITGADPSGAPRREYSVPVYENAVVPTRHEYARMAMTITYDVAGLTSSSTLTVSRPRSSWDEQHPSTYWAPPTPIVDHEAQD